MQHPRVKAGREGRKEGTLAPSLGSAQAVPPRTGQSGHQRLHWVLGTGGHLRGHGSPHVHTPNPSLAIRASLQ